MSNEEDRQFLRERVQGQIEDIRHRLNIQREKLSALMDYIADTASYVDDLESCLADERREADEQAAS